MSAYSSTQVMADLQPSETSPSKEVIYIISVTIVAGFGAGRPWGATTHNQSADWCKGMRSAISERRRPHPLLSTASVFYTLYPSRENPNQLPNKRGYYEDLDQYCGLSFIISEYVDGLINTTPLQDLGSDVSIESLFDWLV